MNLTNCLCQRRMARTTLRNYIVENKVSIEDELNILIPETIKQMPSEEFSNWIFKIASKIFKIKDEIIENLELVDLLADFVCCENNVNIAKISQHEII